MEKINPQRPTWKFRSEVFSALVFLALYKCFLRLPIFNQGSALRLSDIKNNLGSEYFFHTHFPDIPWKIDDGVKAESLHAF